MLWQLQHWPCHDLQHLATQQDGGRLQQQGGSHSHGGAKRVCCGAFLLCDIHLGESVSRLMHQLVHSLPWNAVNTPRGLTNTQLAGCGVDADTGGNRQCSRCDILRLTSRLIACWGVSPCQPVPPAAGGQPAWSNQICSVATCRQGAQFSFTRTVVAERYVAGAAHCQIARYLVCDPLAEHQRANAAQARQ